ncbi:MAG TPA: DUF1003 domain-containing protein [Mycobacteriales bacterium]|jgi:uncharacterized membrane protein|nr:DUF1003 domain-containing protein [Mycobacteriales bacterium]
MVRRPNARLDQPKGVGHRLNVPITEEVFGRYSERLARYFGTARYLIIQTLLVVIWIGLNVWLGSKDAFDKYPFILLNLAFSTQAAYAAPLILLAQNRQTDRDRVSLEEDRAQNTRSIADTEYLAREIAAIRIALGDVATRDFVRAELAKLDGGRDDDR